MLDVSEEGSSAFWVGDVVYVRTDGPDGYDQAVRLQMEEETGQTSKSEDIEYYLVGDRGARLEDGEWSEGPRAEYADDDGHMLVDSGVTPDNIMRDYLRSLTVEWQAVETEDYQGVKAIRYAPVDLSALVEALGRDGLEIVEASLWVAEEGDYLVGYEVEVADPDSDAYMYFFYGLEDINADLSVEMP